MGLINDAIENLHHNYAKRIAHRHPNLSEKELLDLAKKQSRELQHKSWDAYIELIDAWKEKYKDDITHNFGEFMQGLYRLWKNGFNPIKITTMWLELHYIFETEEEAEKAYEMFGNGDDYMGLERFEEYYPKYEAKKKEWYGEESKIAIDDITPELKERFMKEDAQAVEDYWKICREVNNELYGEEEEDDSFYTTE